jgi:hypothetical protein
MTEEEVKRWDQWFETVSGFALDCWKSVKSHLPHQAWLNWACIIEMNRLNGLEIIKDQNMCRDEEEE